MAANPGSSCTGRACAGPYPTRNASDITRRSGRSGRRCAGLILISAAGEENSGNCEQEWFHTLAIARDETPGRNFFASTRVNPPM